MLAAGGSLSGRTQLSKGASMVLNGDVVSTGDIGKRRLSTVWQILKFLRE